MLVSGIFGYKPPTLVPISNISDSILTKIKGRYFRPELYIILDCLFLAKKLTNLKNICKTTEPNDLKKR